MRNLKEKYLREFAEFEKVYLTEEEEQRVFSKLKESNIYALKKDEGIDYEVETGKYYKKIYKISSEDFSEMLNVKLNRNVEIIKFMLQVAFFTSLIIMFLMIPPYGFIYYLGIMLLYFFKFNS